ncbi:hypothetical protein [Streptomyces sp. NPDC047706]|uniref:hypothetical protein n=1 Tax=Streptomyces sp. NPDC047706 TaxID=3365486 RepID=UPI00371862C8
MSDLTPDYPLDDFDRITTQVRMVSPLTALFAEAEERLLATNPGGFTPEDIGRLAWQLLPETERDTAFAELLYTFWEAVTADQETWTRIDLGGGAA